MSSNWKNLNEKINIKNGREIKEIEALSWLNTAQTTARMLDQKNIIIPEYQRGFVWDDKEVLKFLSAILEDYNQSEKQNSFLGTIITYKKNKENINTFEVIDGQQRLMALTIFTTSGISLLKDLPVLNPRLENNITSTIKWLGSMLFPQQKSLIEHHDKDLIKYLNKIIFRKIYETTEDVVIDNDEKGVSKIFNVCKRFLKENFNSNPGEIHDFLNYVFHGTYFYNQEVEEKSHAFERFERVNNIGKKLTDWELIKNYLFLSIEKLNISNNYSEKLSEVAISIERNDFENIPFILFILLKLKYPQPFARLPWKKKVYDKFKTAIKETKKEKDMVENSIDVLSELVDSYQKLRNHKTSNKQLNNLYRFIESNRFTQILHLVIALYTKEGKVTESLIDYIKRLVIYQLLIIKIENQRGSTVETRLRTIIRDSNTVDEFHKQTKESFNSILQNKTINKIEESINRMELNSQQKISQEDMFSTLMEAFNVNTTQNIQNDIAKLIKKWIE